MHKYLFSTVYAVYKYVNKILDTLDTRKIAVVLLLDLSKAYDRVKFIFYYHTTRTFISNIHFVVRQLWLLSLKF